MGEPALRSLLPAQQLARLRHAGGWASESQSRRGVGKEIFDAQYPLEAQTKTPGGYQNLRTLQRIQLFCSSRTAEQQNFTRIGIVPLMQDTG